MRKLITAALGLALVGALAAPAFAAPGDATLTVTVPSSVSFAFTSATTCNFGLVPPGGTSEQLNCLTYNVTANIPWQLTLEGQGSNPQGVSFDARKNGNGAYTVNLAGSGLLVWRTGTASGSFGDDFRVNVADFATAGQKTYPIQYVVSAT
jgi:hypothetical protein